MAMLMFTSIVIITIIVEYRRRFVLIAARLEPKKMDTTWAFEPMRSRL